MPSPQELSRLSDDIISDDRIAEVIALASRLKAQAGGLLDDAAIEAVAEATGAPLDYVRVAVRSMPAAERTDNRRRTGLDWIREQLATVDSRLRSSVLVGSLATVSGVTWALAGALPTAFSSGRELFAGLGALFTVISLAAACSARSRQQAGILGAIWGPVFYFSYQLLATVFAIFNFGSADKGWPMLFVYTILGFFLGIFGHAAMDWFKNKMGLKDAASERQALVKQLMEIQDRLKQQDRHAAFLSVDIVGSTRMKAENDAMAIEYTFGEYHKFVEAIAVKHGGQIHSTAGDGVIAVFDEPSHGFDAGRAILAGLFEFNAFRNRTKAAIQLRLGLHSGTVGAAGHDASAVNFAHVIDVAAHLQHSAEPGALAISEAAAADLPGGLNSVGQERISVDGVQAAIWRPRSQVSVTQIG